MDVDSDGGVTITGGEACRLGIAQLDLFRDREQSQSVSGAGYSDVDVHGTFSKEILDMMVTGL